jgi:hypothetical protein
MTKYAYFDHWAAPPAPVSGWYNTDYFGQYDTLPAAADLLLMTEEEWDARLEGLWAVDSGTLVPYTPPVPPPTADEVLAEKIDAGIMLDSASNNAIDGLWALDARTLAELGAVARDFNTGMGLPQDATTFVYPNAAGDPVALTGSNVVAVYRAMRDMVDTLSRQAAILGQGGTPDWPLQAATIP